MKGLIFAVKRVFESGLKLLQVSDLPTLSSTYSSLLPNRKQKQRFEEKVKPELCLKVSELLMIAVVSVFLIKFLLLKARPGSDWLSVLLISSVLSELSL